MTDRPRIRVMLLLAFRNVLLNWRHSLATMLAIAAGFSAVSLFDGFINDMNKEMVDRYINRGMLGHVVIEKQGASKSTSEDPWTDTLSVQEQDFIKSFVEKNKRVSASMRFLSFMGLASNGRISTVFAALGYDVQEGLKFRGERWKWDAVAGKPLYMFEKPVILLGSGLARHLDCELPDDFNVNYNSDGSLIAEERPFSCQNPNLQLSVTTEHIQVNAVNLMVGGMVDIQLREYNNRIVVMPLETAQRLVDSDRVSRVSILLKNHSDIFPFIREFQAEAKKQNKHFDAVRWLDHSVAATARGGMEILSTFRNLFLSVVAVIAAMSVANTMMKSINERIREIGTLRSIGFRRSDIILMFSSEGFFIGVFSCIAGLILTVLLGLIISHAGLTFKAGILSAALPVRISLDFSTWFSSMIVLCLITLGVSWLVSRKAARTVIAETMRHVA
ncbi:MAG: ABC transporter permease [Bdellovibrio sp.]|nr:ABC transporter permease [Bdellovibrio sp.]